MLLRTQRRLIKELLFRQEQIMADLTALTAAVVDLGVKVDAVVSEVATLKAGQTDQTAVDAITTQVGAARDKLAGLVSAPAT